MVVVVPGIIDQTVVGEDDPLCPPGPGAHCVNVAFGPAPPLGVGEQALVVTEAAAADALARGVGPQVAAGPAQLFRLFFGDVVGGQMSEQMNVEGYLVLAVIDPVLREP